MIFIKKLRVDDQALPYLFNIQKRNQLYQNVFQFNFILFSERFIDDENVVDSRLLPKIYKELMSASHATHSIIEKEI